jgi:hypothetical protein
MSETTNPNNASPTIRSLLCAAALAAATLTLQTTVYAQSAPAVDHSHTPGASAPDSNKPAMDMHKSMDMKSMGMHKSMDDMHKKMAAMPMTGNPDVDFAMMMVAHHQGAIAMAQAEIDTGKDPVMIKAAKKIIAAQKKEIVQFEDWLKKHPHPMK